MSGSAKQYVAFEEQRTRPVRDLIAGIPEIAVRVAIDLGCGPGNSTAVPQARFAKAAISGLDSSSDMIAAARRRLPALDFEIGSIGTWAYGIESSTYGVAIDAKSEEETSDATSAVSESLDLILANAVLQWLADHAKLFPALLANLTSGGVLAVR